METEKPKAGEFIKFNIEYKLEDRDSVLQSTFGSIPGLQRSGYRQKSRIYLYGSIALNECW